ncbi:hypothetical protein [Rhodospirillum sp. A1_3_36]|uniref:hypothetical protein n=1 Tax=Rhodospirillum sp. A1_3_36 TaxID=3391666 RepID=UPI0039A77DA2
MRADHVTAGQHLAAVLTVVALSVVLSGLVDVSNARLGGQGVEMPLAGDLGSISAPAHSQWGRTVLGLSNMR